MIQVTLTARRHATPSVGHFYRIKNLFIKSLLFCKMHSFRLENGVQDDELTVSKIACDFEMTSIGADKFIA